MDGWMDVGGCCDKMLRFFSWKISPSSPPGTKLTSDKTWYVNTGPYFETDNLKGRHHLYVLALLCGCISIRG